MKPLEAARYVWGMGDLVAKNGCLLLNVGPAADGTIPAPARERLLGMGDWLRTNSEAIYGTRPWKIYGEGPTRQAKAGGFSENADKAFTAQDIRFTKAELRIASRGSGAGRIESITLLGDDEKLRWKQDDAALIIQPVAKWPCQHAVTFKVLFAK